MMARCGKRIGSTVYVHRTAMSCLSDQEYDLVDRATAVMGRRPGGWREGWTVVKVNAREGRVTFLTYPSFFRDAHPALKKATLVKLHRYGASIREMDFSTRRRPPILHRKELMLG